MANALGLTRGRVSKFSQCHGAFLSTPNSRNASNALTRNGMPIATDKALELARDDLAAYAAAMWPPFEPPRHIKAIVEVLEWLSGATAIAL